MHKWSIVLQPSTTSVAQRRVDSNKASTALLHVTTSCTSHLPRTPLGDVYLLLHCLHRMGQDAAACFRSRLYRLDLNRSRSSQIVPDCPILSWRTVCAGSSILPLPTSNWFTATRAAELRLTMSMIYIFLVSTALG